MDATAMYSDQLVVENTDVPPGLNGCPPPFTSTRRHTATTQKAPAPADDRGARFPTGREPVLVMDTNGMPEMSTLVAPVNVTSRAWLVRSHQIATDPLVTLAVCDCGEAYTPTVASSQSGMDVVAGTPAVGIAAETVEPVPGTGNATPHTV